MPYSLAQVNFMKLKFLLNAFSTLSLHLFGGLSCHILYFVQLVAFYWFWVCWLFLFRHLLVALAQWASALFKPAPPSLK